ncbi:methyl-accepting chemotaxis protein [Cellvibrio japonicus Ueda107]|uniref:Methyl-accepting chemotaxis protein n=1 Tax=Cellvibrio japonicus (strain Ueda107) TaxID=498211 RepID=B3PJ00_CELJU|nr:methyl-accepting chemotaxis protein [Cellvibrio japonicus Ueda107]
MHAFYVVIETAVLIVLVKLASRLLVVAQEVVNVTETMIGDSRYIDLNIRALARHNAILDHFNWLLDSIASALKSALGAQSEADKNLEVLSGNSRQLVAIADESHQAAESIRVAMDNMHDSFVAVAEQIQRAAGLAEDTARAQEEGKVAVRHSREGIAELSHLLGDTANAIDTLAGTARRSPVPWQRSRELPSKPTCWRSMRQSRRRAPVSRGGGLPWLQMKCALLPVAPSYRQRISSR